MPFHNKQTTEKGFLSYCCIRSTFEYCSIIWHPISSNQISQFKAIQEKAVKWINGQQFDHNSDAEYITKLRELDILPVKLKFAADDLILFYNVCNKIYCSNQVT